MLLAQNGSIEEHLAALRLCGCANEGFEVLGVSFHGVSPGEAAPRGTGLTITDKKHDIVHAQMRC